MSPHFSRTLNAFGLLAVSVVLIAAFADQILFGDLPCPLCILQRAGFLGVAMGLALNVKFGPRPSHYAVMLISALAGAAVSLRQTLLHIVPGEGAYGDAFFGLHFYAWAFAIFMVCVAGTAALLLFDGQFAGEGRTLARMGAFGGTMMGLALLLALANGISTGLECGAGLCPDNPTGYQLLGNGSLGDLLPALRKTVGQ